MYPASPSITPTHSIACMHNDAMKIPRTLRRGGDGGGFAVSLVCVPSSFFPHQSAIWVGSNTWVSIPAQQEEGGWWVGKKTDQQSGPGVIIVVKPPILTNRQQCGSPTVPRGTQHRGVMTMFEQ